MTRVHTDYLSYCAPSVKLRKDPSYPFVLKGRNLAYGPTMSTLQCK